MNLEKEYRPKKFKEILGQEELKFILINSIKKNTFFPAYLLIGKSGIGKTSIARVFSRAINCLKFLEEEEPCYNCENCNNSNSIYELNCALYRGIDEIRKINNFKNYFILKKKNIFILDECHMLTEEAMDALLKILEEPGKNNLFILVTTNYRKIKETLFSRCLSFFLTPLSLEKNLKFLQFLLIKKNISLSLDVLKFLVISHNFNLRKVLVDIEKYLLLNCNKELFKKIIGYFNIQRLENFLQFLVNKELQKKKFNLEEFIKPYSTLVLPSLLVKVLLTLTNTLKCEKQKTFKILKILFLNFKNFSHNFFLDKIRLFILFEQLLELKLKEK